jgi:REP element-mobilizing transposase RayT
MLATLRQDQALSDIVRKIKAGSSAWAHETFPDAGGFWWQAGYGAFTVSHSALDRVTAYIDNQEEHHRERTFQDEFRELLVRHEVAFDEQYLWD